MRGISVPPYTPYIYPPINPRVSIPPGGMVRAGVKREKPRFYEAFQECFKELPHYLIQFMNTKLLIKLIRSVIRKDILYILLHYHTIGMLKTQRQFTKFIESNPEGSVFIYATKGQDYMLIIFQTGVIEHITADLLMKLRDEKIIFPMVCHTVDRNKLSEKEAMKR